VTPRRALATWRGLARVLASAACGRYSPTAAAAARITEPGRNGPRARKLYWLGEGHPSDPSGIDPERWLAGRWPELIAYNEANDYYEPDERVSRLSHCSADNGPGMSWPECLLITEAVPGEPRQPHRHLPPPSLTATRPSSNKKFDIPLIVKPFQSVQTKNLS
jgi:hypothetical protein